MKLWFFKKPHYGALIQCTCGKRWAAHRTCPGCGRALPEALIRQRDFINDMTMI